jgi:hypothetical protein
MTISGTLVVFVLRKCLSFYVLVVILLIDVAMVAEVQLGGARHLHTVIMFGEHVLIDFLLGVGAGSCLYWEEQTLPLAAKLLLLFDFRQLDDVVCLLV